MDFHPEADSQESEPRHFEANLERFAVDFLTMRGPRRREFPLPTGRARARVVGSSFMRG
jgi:hypothetical protein